jgi:hypothetical protein
VQVAADLASVDVDRVGLWRSRLIGEAVRAASLLVLLAMLVLSGRWRRHAIGRRMVAVVLPDERAMYMEFKKLDIDMKRVSGIYSGESNRVMTHDSGRASSIMSTVRHEAAHQSAFNSGAHSRVNDTPRWITEGLGQIFEPAAMTDPRGASQLPDRVNRDSLNYLRREVTGDDTGQFPKTAMELISSDMMFKNEKQINEAYAVAWAMIFYLAERQPHAFAELLNYTASRRPFQGLPTCRPYS